jgi:hypothetical protein
MQNYTAHMTARIAKMKRKMKTHRASAKDLSKKFEEGFRQFGITHFPAYSNPQDFATRFERCSILVENSGLSTSAGTTPPTRK